MAIQKKERRKLFIYLAAFVLVGAAGFVYKMFFDGNSAGFQPAQNTPNATGVAELTIHDTDPTTSTTEIRDTEPPPVEVYICGQVQTPGVYSFASGVILDDVIKRAGGFTASAAQDRVNLVYVITSNLSVYIPTEEECESGFTDDSGIIRAYGSNSWKDSVQNSGSGAGSASGPVNINTASLEELMTLPGIGEVLANQIIRYREEHPFSSCDEIRNVSGIGDAKYDKIRELIICR